MQTGKNHTERQFALIAPAILLLISSLSGVLAAGTDNPVPWPRMYKIKPLERARLTDADVVGPDGIVYPNWTRCGVQGGIPNVRAVAKIEDFGGKANDNVDDSEALAKACAAVGRTGGAVLLGEGTYHLDRPVTIYESGTVIRGRGPERTRLIFTYAIRSPGVAFYHPRSGGRIGPETRIELHAAPAGLSKMTVWVDDQQVGQWDRSKHSGNTFSFAIRGRAVTGKVSNGRHTLKGVAEYKDGAKRSAEIPVIVDESYQDRSRVSDSRAAIMFAGRGTTGRKLKLAKDGKRGDTVLHLQNTDGLKAGDCLYIDGPATQRWKKLTRNACKWGLYRNYEAVITAIDGRTIEINQPLRIEFPIIDGSYVQKVEPLRHCGVEDLYIEQTENLWISTVLFYHGWNCWARNVTVKKCGRFPIYGSMAKWCEIRDCVFDDAWFKGGGGTAYAGWDRCWDCLMENVETFKMRHGPLFQWAASGCVIRKSTFHDSDGQWHAGWTNENLIEQCVIESVRGHGGYGYGLWASPPEDTAHGPNGPRNVVYNCRVSSPRAGLWMGGMNENWLILHNRFVVGSGPGVFAKTVSFDHIIKGNAFVLKDSDSPMIQLATADCVGIEVTDNVLAGGNGRFVSGTGDPTVLRNNRVVPASQAQAPQPAVPSIYQWQQEHVQSR